MNDTGTTCIARLASVGRLASDLAMKEKQPALGIGVGRVSARTREDVEGLVL